ncbi:MAG: EAL domain-containing protein [Spongiibacteraceae bacterium]
MNEIAVPTAHSRDLDLALNALIRDPLLWQCSLDDAFTRVLQATLPALRATIASLWQNDDAQSCLLLRQHLDVSNPLQTTLEARSRHKLPKYFAALTHDRYLASTNPRTDIYLAELSNNYFEARAISAVLHVPLWSRGQLWGVFCIECVEHTRTWTPDEISFAIALAELLGQLVLNEKVARNEDIYFALARQASIGILRTDQQKQIIYCNDCWRELTGMNTPIWDENVLRSLVHPDDLDTVMRQIDALYAVGSGELAYRIVRPDGRELNVVAHIVFEFERVGIQRVLRGALAILLDVTQQEQTQRVLQKLSAKQQAILQGVARVIFATDANGAITIFNRAAENLLGYRVDEVIGCNVATLLHDPAELIQHARELSLQLSDPIAADFEALVAAARKETSAEAEWTYRCRDGSQIPVSLSITALRDDRDNITGFVGIAKDLREQHRLEALTRSRDRLIQHMLRGLGAKIGVDFFDTLAAELSTALGHCAVQGLEVLPGSQPPKGRTLIQWGKVRRDVEVPLAGTPALEIINTGRAQHWPVVQTAYPDVAQLRRDNVLDYMGVPLLASDGSIMGALIIFSFAQFEDAEFVLQLLQIFSLRAANELERLRHERAMLARNDNQQWILEYSAPLHERNSVQAVGEITARALHAHSSAPLVTVTMCCPQGYRLLAHTGGMVRPHDYEMIHPRYRFHELVAHANNRLLISRDLDTDLADAPVLLKLMRARKTNALAFIALFDGDIEVGHIVLEFKDIAVLDTLDIESMLIFTRSVGLALSKAMQQEQLEYQASHDNLTGLFNRAVLHRDFAEWQSGGGQSALLLLDLNRFKEVNDTLGHHIGDQLLRQVGERLQAKLPPLDCCLYRLGGDEFAIFAHGLDNTKAMSLANDLLVELNNPFTLDHVNLEIGGSIGVALYPEHGDDSHALLRSADVAMYKAKQSGIGTTLYHRDLDLNSTERLEMIAEFRQGIRERELVLHYQPKIALATGATIGFEALVRWQHPRLGLLSPQRFLPLIEMTDAIHEMTHALLEQACAQLQVWREAGHHHLLSVNLSARNLIDDRVATQIKILFEAYPLACNYLDLEVTESALIHEPDRALSMMQRIAALGVSFSIDDFGTGYSSLSHLRKMPISTLKIDHTFILNMLDNPQDKVIVESTIALAHNLGLTVVAEGVETDAALEYLRQMGCDQAQGYLLGKPVPVNQLAT